MSGLTPAPTGWVRSDSPTDTPLRFGQVTLAGYGRSLPKSTSCAWNRFTWLPMLSPSPAPGGVWIVAFSHRCNRFSAVRGVVVGAGSNPPLRHYATGNVRSDTRPYGMGSVRLTHGHAIALRASDLSRIWTQFAKKHILRLEPLHLATNAISITCAGWCVDCGVFAQV